MGGFTLKVKTKKGQHVLSTLQADSTVELLKTLMAELTQIPSENLNILSGFPPKSLDLSNISNTLQVAGIANGDTLIVEEKISTPTHNSREQELKDAQLAMSLAQEGNEDDEFNGILLKKVVPADNSCLFTSIGFVLNGMVNTDSGMFMRQLIAENVRGDLTTYNEGFLGRPNLEYCEWILRMDSWGGAIEISILSNHYGLEIDVVDITNAIIIRFGEDKNYGQRVFLLFDGIHYDPLYLESLTNGSQKTIFPIEAENVYQQAEALAKEAKSSRQFTDINKFTLRCMQCDSKFFTGQTEATQHAKATGHTNFGEV